MALIAIFLLELLAVTVVSNQTWLVYNTARVAHDDLNWSVYQLDKELQRLKVSLLEHQAPAAIRLRGQILSSRVNILKYDAIFENIRKGKLSTRLDAFFQQTEPLLQAASNFSSENEIGDLIARLNQAEPIFTQIGLDIDQQVRAEVVQRRATLEGLISRTIGLVMLLSVTALILGTIQYGYIRKLEKAVAAVNDQGEALLKIWEQAGVPLIIVAVPFAGADSIQFSNAAALAAFGSNEALAEALAPMISALEQFKDVNANLDNFKVHNRFYNVSRFSLGKLKIGQKEHSVLLRVTDVTDRTESAKTSRELLVKLSDAEQWRFIGEAAAAVVHEIRQPLAAASNFLYVASDNISTEEGLDSLPYLIERSKDMLFRVQQISRQMRSLIPADKSSWEVLGVQTLLDEARETIDAGDLFQTQIEIHASEPLLCRGSAIQLTQVFVNLIRNALEASDKKGPGLKVTVDVRREGDLSVTGISDAGGGIPPEIMESIFEPVRSKKPGGLGLGLAISRHLTQLHSGTLSCHTNAAGGTTFEVRLPIAQPVYA
ncbi:MAG: hypothetical protein KGO53_04330 [Alphaproteobacteria bacterium]|nr:hypothetical protein [Alphaproteobacteria bacterium]